MDSVLAGSAAIAATGFFLDLVRNYLARERPHIAAYAAGVGAFAIATWALFAGVTFGWTSASYRTFFVFGGIMNILLLALGSMFLVVGRRSGHAMLALLFPLFAISVPMTLSEPFVNALPSSGVPAGSDLFEQGFGPRMWAAIGGGLGTTILIILAVVSLVRFWRTNRQVVWGNLAILAGTFAAASGGTGLALGEAAGFAVSLLIAVTLIWMGFRVASGARASSDVASAGRDASIGVG